MSKVPNQLYSTQNFHNSFAQITSVNALNSVNLFTASPNDSIVYAVNVSSTATTTKVVELLVDGSHLGHCIVDSGAGWNEDMRSASGLFNLYLPTDGNGNRILTLEGGRVLQAKMLVALESGEKIDFAVIGEDY